MDKTTFNRFAIALCAGILFLTSSCKKDDEKMTYEFDDEDDFFIETPVPTEDALTEKLDLPTVVVGNTFSNIGQAFVNRLTNRQQDFDENTMVIVFDAYTLFTEDFVDIIDKAAEVYNRGGVMVIENTENLEANDAELVLYNNHFDECYVLTGKEPDTMILDEDPSDSTKYIATEAKHDDYKLTAYQCGLTADIMVSWIKKQCEPTNTLKIG